MSYQDAMNTILPPQQGRSPHITGHYGEHRDGGPHGGSDFNYVGGQSGVNLTHPRIHSPVAGTVEFVGGRFGTIGIRDGEGNLHQLLHTDRQSVVVGQHVEPGTEIGTMGGRGPRGADQYAQHVHYQMKDAQGRNLNPEDFWNRRQSVGARDHGHDGHDHDRGHARSAQRDDGVLHRGERGEQVLALQENLNRLGFRDDQGRPLQADGEFGDRTRQALLAFQRAHGLEADGIAGRNTLAQLGRAESAPLLSNPAHPNYAMYRQAVDGLERLGPQAGLRNREELERAAGTLTYEARVAGMNRIDHVVPNLNGSGLFAVQGGLQDPAHHRVFADRGQAVAQSVEQSSQRLQQDAPAQAQAQVQADPQQSLEARQHSGPRMVIA
ncbi:peptidoglycan-binding protein [Lysobacter sp. BMK333-48F3]|uniref:XVIPCD domain-containing protein n=1 Tax=Lysobacter sp. BMK333-48F3 TaxID=2867962 RepID=UPI001C8C2D28|nr:XVIPCD domain-containing protein [Lysobacter sp. BMK333-48F3]MBX9403406.1 peptidoglycan-binding protein [Lysobacter sp. BMK333-48F3]